MDMLGDVLRLSLAGDPNVLLSDPPILRLISALEGERERERGGQASSWRRRLAGAHNNAGRLACFVCARFNWSAQRRVICALELPLMVMPFIFGHLFKWAAPAKGIWCKLERVGVNFFAPGSGAGASSQAANNRAQRKWCSLEVSSSSAATRGSSNLVSTSELGS